MRRKDREITDFYEIAGVLRRADTIRLGINGNPYPYVVPLSFGFEAADGKISIYFHGAAEGLKHELIAADNRVCVEASVLRRFAECGGITAEYESFIGFGRAEVVSGGEPAERAMALMLDHCGFPGHEYDKKAMDNTRIYKITLTGFSGKRNLA